MSIVAQRCSYGVGDRIDRSFEISKILGEGSFGIVYAVKDFSGNTYALKLLKLWEVPSEIRDSLMTRFEMEFETGRIDNDYLVRSISHGAVDGNPYILMEYCSGGDLLSVMSKEKLYLPTVATHVLCGLKALHRCGKVHRDLKPENVLRKANGNYALTDFGISGDRNKRMTERNILGKPKQIFGTYAYMPPEQLNPRKDATVLPTTDIFSFGVMMYQLITGELPYGRLESESDLVSYLKRGKNGEWDKNCLYNTPTGYEWYPLIQGCLVPDFKTRLQAADDVLKLVPHLQYMPSFNSTPQDYQTKIVNGVLLRIMQGEEYGKVYWLDDMLVGDRAILSVGRKDFLVPNDIEIAEENSSYISRRHCTLELDYNIGSWIIRDGQWSPNGTGGYWNLSTNGTYVNSKEVSMDGMPFGPGDIISIGDTKLRAEAY